MQFNWVMFVGGSVHEEPLHKGDDRLTDMTSSNAVNRMITAEESERSDNKVRGLITK